MADALEAGIQPGPLDELAARSLLGEHGFLLHNPHFSRPGDALAAGRTDGDGSRPGDPTGAGAPTFARSWFAPAPSTSGLATLERSVTPPRDALARFRSARVAQRFGSLELQPASGVRPGMVMLAGDGSFECVERAERVLLETPVYDLDVEPAHTFVANGLVTHNSIYAFRGADIRNILEFEQDFPDAKTIALEQNYRSTNTILQAANHVIENNRERKPKNLWSELGDGLPVRVIEVADEDAEARFVASEIAGLLDDDYSPSEIAVVYRMNAQSRVLEQVLTRQDVDYQVIGGPRFYERAEVRDVTAYLQAIDNPFDAIALRRIANRPRRGVGDASLARLQTFADAQGFSLWDAMDEPEDAGLGTAQAKAVRRFRDAHAVAAVGGAGARRPRSHRTGHRAHRVRRLRSRPTRTRSESDGKIENLGEFVTAAAAHLEQTEEPNLSTFLQEVSLVSDQDTIRSESSLVTLMTMHNAKGLEFRAVFMIGMEEGIFPHSRSIEENTLEEERRLAYVGMTRAKERLTLHARDVADALGQVAGEPPLALPRRAAGDAPRARAAAPGVVGQLRHAAADRRPAPLETPELSTGDSVRHTTMGEGVVTRIEPGGVVTVRFANDGVERRLMLDYAPLEKI